MFATVGALYIRKVPDEEEDAAYEGMDPAVVKLMKQAKTKTNPLNKSAAVAAVGVRGERGIRGGRSH